MKAIFSLLILYASIFSASLSYSGQSCAGLLADHLDSKPSYRLKKPQGISEEGIRYNTKDRLDIYVLNNSGRVVGSLMGGVHEGLYYDFSFDISDEAYQRRGISGEFFNLFFKKFKKTKPVRSILISDNLEIFLVAIDQGLSNEEAASVTPHVKALSRFGYSLTDVFFEESETLEVRVFLSPPQD